MPAPAYTTFMEVVNLAAQSVGHPVTTDVASSLDEAILRMGFYTNQSCMELLDKNNWQSLIKTGTIAVIADAPGQTEKGFTLPADFHRFVDETQWNATSRLPALGPISPQNWQYMIVRGESSINRFTWRRRDGLLYIKSPPSTSQNFTFEYISKNWAVDADDSSAKGLMIKNGDYHLFAWNLVVLFARWKWLEAEGYDSSSAETAFNTALESHTGGDKGASTLSLVPGGSFPYISPERNLPPSGYGS